MHLDILLRSQCRQLILSNYDRKPATNEARPYKAASLMDDFACKYWQDFYVFCDFKDGMTSFVKLMFVVWSQTKLNTKADFFIRIPILLPLDNPPSM